MSKEIGLSHFTEEHLTSTIEILQYIKSHPGHIDKVIEVLDDARVELQHTDSFSLDNLTLRAGEVVLELEHIHSKYCNDGNMNYDCEASNMTRTRKV